MRKDFHLQSLIRTVSLGTGGFDSIGGGQYHSHTAVALDFRLPEDTHLHTRLGNHLLKVVKHHTVRITLDHNGARC